MKRTVLCNIRFEHYSKVHEEKAFSVEPNQPSQILLGPQSGLYFCPLHLTMKNSLWRIGIRNYFNF